MTKASIDIDSLIKIVANGGVIRTGVDIYNPHGLLLLEKDVPVDKVKPLVIIKESGIVDISINPSNAGGLWDDKGKPISLPKPGEKIDVLKKDNSEISQIEKKIDQIREMKNEASVKYKKARESIKKVLFQIKDTGGEFDTGEIEETVTQLIDFLSSNENAFSYLSREIFAYDDYLYNHSTNVCTIGTAILRKFNDSFSRVVNNYLSGLKHGVEGNTKNDSSFVYYVEDEIKDIAMGFFLHDAGKVMLPDEILNKKGKLTPEEFELIKRHSFDKGLIILEKNKQDNNPFLRNIVKYHHGPLYVGEERTYPGDKPPSEIPNYTKVCKLADIYDAMTSKRSYKNAINPISVVTDIFRSYAEKDSMLQLILHSFVKTVGIYPPGSVAQLINGQMAYVLDSDGPLVIPITDVNQAPLVAKSDPIKLASGLKGKGLAVDRRQPLLSPLEAYDILPSYLKEAGAAKGSR